MPSQPTDLEPGAEPGSSEVANRRQRFAAWWELVPGNVRGAAWVFVGGMLFAIMAALIKLLGQRLHIAEILAVRQGVMVILVLPVILRSFPGSLKTRFPGLHAARIVFAMTAMLAGFTALIHIPLADATAISFARAFFITILAIIFLKEEVGLRRWMATIVGFIGVLIMVRPDTSGALDIYALFAAGSAAAAAMALVIIRKLSQVEPPTTILTYQAVFVGLLIALPAYWWWQAPTTEEWGLLILMGFVSYAAQYANIRAYRNGEATAIASLDYIRLLYATGIGIYLFAEWPGTDTLIGAAIIISASLYTVQREARRGRKLARAEESRNIET